jgi:penicillin-binding protein 1C
LYNFLSMAGISQLQSETHYGLALVLGGGEVTMEELAGLYSILANGGRLQTINYLKYTPKKEGAALVSAEASFITLDMLRHNPRPGEDDSYNLNSGWPIAWKTGTSWGFRDAWSVGVVGPYVLAVWIGNFDSRGNPAFVGIDTAAPLFFRIADGLYLRKPEALPAPVPPAGVSQVSVCSASGDLPNAWCPLRHKTWYIPGKSPIKVSQLHQPVAISLRTGQPVCPPYQADQVRMEVMEFWGSDMQKLFRQAGLPRRSPPKCQQGFQTQAPDISSPVRHVSYQLRTSRPEVTIPLQAKAAAQVRTLFWFDDNRYIGSSDPQVALAYRPVDAGIHNIRVVDDLGQVAEREMQVDWLE